MKKALVVAGIMAAMAWPAGVRAHEGHAHKVMGTVAVLDATHIEVDTKDGKKESYALSKDTKYLKGKVPALAADVKVGARVVLSVVGKEGKRTVTEVVMAGEEKH